MRTTRRLFIPALVLSLALLLVLSVIVIQAQQFGSTWLGQYFTNPDLSGSPYLSKIDTQVNFNFGDSSPIPNTGIPADGFSVRWTTQEYLAPGYYRFYLSADDGARAIVNGTTIIDFYSNTGTQQTQVADVYVDATTEITLVVEYADRAGAAMVQFFWEPAALIASPTAGPSPTPTATGLPPIPAGALTATVIRASVLNIRDAPSLGGGRIARILRGQTYQVVGRNDDATWFLLELGGYTGWAYGYYLYFNFNEFTAPVRSATTLYGLPSGYSDTGVLVQALAGMKLRSAPNVFAEQTGRITWGSFLPVVARTSGGDWYQVLWKGTVGWVFTGYLKQVEGDMNNVPVVNP
ncbi:SH3 domain-containing protein [Phototrophicus methaneseepsis]|uniref:SH3 domain-containing protein n=1 Tax=Phototrophicus methaneseepsis TaxID=2710758 RepID=A0A7S8E9I2_9CHLR|nr:SH3 domain-containing protein [Phototrophicus methaneseepsis]QPC82869.1 SH3 domain-containing protein [Phototrophicus methaneseepsis]